MKRLVLAAVVGAFLFAGAAPALAARPLRVQTSVSTRFLYFADTVVARLTVVIDRRSIRPGSVRVAASFPDWEQVAPTKTTSLASGTLAVRSWTFRIACTAYVCLPSGKPVLARFSPVVVTATTTAGSLLTLRGIWPRVSIAGRFGPSVSDATPAFEIDEQLPAATYRIDPTTTALVLDLAAGLFGGAGLVLVAFAVLRRRAVRDDEISALSRAVSFVRQATMRSSGDRRRAVGLLGRALASDEGAGLAEAASQIAWSSVEPSRERLERLLELVEAEREAGSE